MTQTNTPQSAPWPTSLARGFCRRCPRCGVGKLFKSFLQVKDTCHNCELELSKSYSADDGPAFFTMSLILFTFVPILLWLDIRYNLSLNILLFVLLPATIILTIMLLPLVKGAFVAASWKAQPDKRDQ
jgi:uncharacterized protein (DUF983 family)